METTRREMIARFRMFYIATGFAERCVMWSKYVDVREQYFTEKSHARVIH